MISFSNFRTKPPENIDEYAETDIKRIYYNHKGTYGRDRITQTMKNAGLTVNHKKVYRIMRKLGLKAVIRRKWNIRKLVKDNVAPNTLNRKFKSNEPLKKLVCDITELKRINDKRYYLFGIMDLYYNHERIQMRFKMSPVQYLKSQKKRSLEDI